MGTLKDILDFLNRDNLWKFWVVVPLLTFFLTFLDTFTSLYLGLLIISSITYAIWIGIFFSTIAKHYKLAKGDTKKAVISLGGRGALWTYTMFVYGLFFISFIILLGSLTKGYLYVLIFVYAIMGFSSSIIDLFLSEQGKEALNGAYVVRKNVMKKLFNRK